MQAYRAALRAEPRVTGPRSNLAALLDQQADQAEYESQRATQLRANDVAARAEERSAEFRQQARRLRREELDLWERDARLAPDNAFVQYRYGMALYLERRLKDAETALRRAYQLEPNDPQNLLGLTLFYKEVKRPRDALAWAEKLVQLRPEDPMFRQVLQEIRQQLPPQQR